MNPDIKLPRKVVIYGASITGKDVAVALGDSIRDLIILEEDSFKAEQIAGELSSVRVINGSGCEADILTEVGVEAADAFVATSDNDHSNLISSVLAKKLGAKTTVILTQQPDYNSIVDELDIDAIINPHNLAIEHILHLARGHNIRSVTKFWECDAEVDEFVAEEGSPITQDVVKNIKFPKSAIIGAVYNGPNVSLAKGDTQVQAGDKVIVFCHNTPLKKLQALFSKN